MDGAHYTIVVFCNAVVVYLSGRKFGVCTAEAEVARCVQRPAGEIIDAVSRNDPDYAAISVIVDGGPPCDMIDVYKKEAMPYNGCAELPADLDR